MHLRDRVILVTGAARGIGAQTARVLARRGARLSLVGREPERLAAVRDELGAGHVWFEADVTDQASLDAAAAGTVAALGGIDVVVANAGISNNGTVASNPADAVARTIEVNLVGVARTVSATVGPVIERRGYLLLVASAASFRAMPGMAAYCASKSGVEAFGASLRLELAHRGVDVGVAHPGWIDTDLVRDAGRDLASFEEMRGQLPWPLRSITSVEACAEAFADGIERRRRKIWVPRSLWLVERLRWLIGGRLGDWVIGRQARDRIPLLEAEVRALGRAFGRSSVEADEPR
jgi:NAD(P)-dependent dehydrogenase (short-subunit alcohol dehydrogenase family)